MNSLETNLGKADIVWKCVEEGCTGQRILNMELPGRRRKERPEGRYTYVVKQDIGLV